MRVDDWDKLAGKHYLSRNGSVCEIEMAKRYTYSALGWILTRCEAPSIEWERPEDVPLTDAPVTCLGCLAT